MGIFDKVKKTTIDSRRYEEKLYEVALEEVEAGERRKGLYAKALSKGNGDKEKADGIYLKLRVQSIIDDVESEQINRRENARALKAIQELNLIEKIKDEPTIENAKKKVKGSSYRVKEGFLEKKYFVEDKYTKQFLYQTVDLIDLHNWLDKNIKQ